MLDVTTLSPSADELNNNEDEEAELPPLQDIINYSFYNVINGLNVSGACSCISFLAS